MPRFHLLNTVASRRLGWLAAGLLAALASCGCTRTEDKSAGEVQENLTTLAKAYTQATQQNNRAPTGIADLKPFLPKDVPDEKLLNSARDGQPFVILWGTDPRTGMDLKPLVIGYEKSGVGGRRMVFTAMGVMTMTDADFAEARFPPGHKP